MFLEAVSGRPFVKRFALCYGTVVCLSCPVCILWPNVWMDQDETGLDPDHIVLDGDQAPPPRKGGTFPMSIVAERLDDLDATWYGSRPRPKPHCV